MVKLPLHFAADVAKFIECTVEILECFIAAGTGLAQVWQQMIVYTATDGAGVCFAICGRRFSFVATLRDCDEIIVHVLRLFTKTKYIDTYAILNFLDCFNAVFTKPAPYFCLIILINLSTNGFNFCNMSNC